MNELSKTPKLIQNSPDASRYAWDEFIASTSLSSRQIYLSIAKRFFSYLIDNNLSLEQVMPSHVQAYLESLDVVLKTKKLHQTVLREIFKFQVLRHAILIDPTENIILPKLNKNEAKSTIAISSKVVIEIIKSCPKDTTVGARDRLIFSLLLYTACRVGSLSKIKMQDIFKESGSWKIILHEKYSKQRTFPVMPQLKKAIDNYLKVGELQNEAPESPLIRACKRGGTSFTERVYPTRRISEVIKKHFTEAGYPECSAHSVRAGAATDLIEKGVDILAVRDLLGHDDVKTTQVYDKSPRDIQKSVISLLGK